MWMNESEIDRASEKFSSHPVLGKGAQFLSAFRDEVNAHSDGWGYWRLPAQAADKLMTLLHGHLFAGMGAYPELPEPTDADVNRAIAPIKAFYTRRGFKAGLKLPPLPGAINADKDSDVTKTKVLSMPNPAPKYIDVTPRGCMTPEGNERVSRTMKEWENTHAEVANALTRFYERWSGHLNVSFFMLPQEAEELKDDKAEIEELLKDRALKQDRFLKAVAGIPE